MLNISKPTELFVFCLLWLLLPSQALPIDQFGLAASVLPGSPDTPVDIPAGSSQSFIIVLTATGEFNPTDVEFEFACTGFSPARTELGLNTLFIGASSTPAPDIFARARTLDNNGIVDIPATSAGSVGGDFLVFGYPTDTFGSPLLVFVCESDPATGLCLSAPADTLTTTMPASRQAARRGAAR